MTCHVACHHPNPAVPSHWQPHIPFCMYFSYFIFQVLFFHYSDLSITPTHSWPSWPHQILSINILWPKSFCSCLRRIITWFLYIHITKSKFTKKKKNLIVFSFPVYEYFFTLFQRTLTNLWKSHIWANCTSLT